MNNVDKIQLLEAHLSTIAADLNKRIKRLEIDAELIKVEIEEIKSKLQQVL